ncbi:pilus assembly protein TadG-related protein [Actinotalea fermentans]|uniref:Membrane protein n=1 Tax=Actinotalea fermentans TaxID=43671 RepID=A0A511YUW6_9CELL|nr:pilus assembly protein TadG-related protein [Actinotalea fermentans]KGM17916.1 hypothetical protein N867_00250 [Actinotalea fermentans ATCC 43279 = JCM 9966 = DSM 3133]GEN78987.1 membrane protein [Actinotalea fermentans]
MNALIWLRHRMRHEEPDVGSVTVFVAVTMLGLLVLCGLVVDGGAKLRATQRADRIAAEAARAAGQAVDPAALVAGDVTVDRAAAVESAQGYLAAAGVTGTVGLSPDGTAIEVDVVVTAPSVFLGLVGIESFSVTGHGRAVLVHGVTGGGT